jgi:DNA primase
MLTTNSINSKDIREQVSLVDLLSRLGFNPVIPSAKEKMYISMIRDSDTRPSFSVNDKLSVWYDHGIGKGGNVIDFGLAYWPKLSFPEVLEKISEICALPLPLPSGNNKVQRRRVVKIPHYEIEYIKELGTNPVITEYLQSRKVFEQASDYLKEIYYYVEDHKKLRKHFFAAGWQNELGSWEVRNKYFKGCLGHKAITFIQSNGLHKINR